MHNDLQFTVSPQIYKSLLTNDKVFTTDLKNDINKICDTNIDNGLYYGRDYSRIPDSIAAMEAAMELFHP